MIDLYPKEHKRIKNNFMILFNYIDYQQHSLPDVPFSTVVHSTASRHGNALAELQLDQTPPNRKVRTTLRQGPYTMHVIRKNNPSHYLRGLFF